MTRARAMASAIVLVLLGTAAATSLATRNATARPQGRPPVHISLAGTRVADSMQVAQTADHADALAMREQRRQEAQQAAETAQAAAQAARAARPAPTPTPVRAPVVAAAPAAATAAPQSVQPIIRSAFAPLGTGAVTWALRVAMCESGYNPNAVNASSGASGLFQFLRSTWALTPYAASSPFDPMANANAAAWLYVRGGPGNWQCK
jgi:hypothetical protein